VGASVVGASVVGASVVGATVVGASVVGAVLLELPHEARTRARSTLELARIRRVFIPVSLAPEAQ